MPTTVVINEVMYHPVLEQSDAELHEFVELFNRSAAAVSLSGWKLDGDVTFAFPAGSSIAPGQHLVVAKSRAGLMAVGKYKVEAAAIVGEYMGEFDNGTGRLRLVDAAAKVIDALTYRSKFPWPLAPDAFGAGEGWVEAKWGPETTHQYMGFSLERVSADVPSSELANWVPSPLDGASPGRANMARGAPAPVVEELTVTPAGKAELPPAAADRVQVVARFSARGVVKSAEVEYYVEDLNVAKKPVQVAPMTAKGGAWEAVLPTQKDNAVVRYRVFADRGAGREQLAPRPTDPMDWFAYWVAAPAIPAGAWQVFVALKDWGGLWTNIVPGMVPEMTPGKPGCVPNPKWEARIPALLVIGGRVYDVRARYAGSRWNRMNGIDIRNWPAGEAPPAPAPLRAVSWNVKLPRYESFEGRRTLYLNKLAQSCPGLQSALGARLATAVGLPAPLVKRFMRVYVNGRYYHYMMDIEHADDDMIQRHHAGPNAKLAGGELIKANSGMYGDEGPFGTADGRPIAAFCSYSATQRMPWTWERKNYEWRNHDELSRMFAELATARAAGEPAVRAFYVKWFDVDKVLTYMALRNWSAAWDDTYHNFNLYKLPDGGKWMFTPMDMDWEFGGAQFNALSSFYLGTMMFTNQWKQWGTFKDSFLGAHRAEFEKRLKDLSATVLAPDAVIKLLDEETPKYNLAEAKAAPGGVYVHPISCDLPTRLNQMKQFIRDRHAQVLKLK